MRVKELITPRYILYAFLILLFIIISFFWFFRVKILENHFSKDLNLNVKIENMVFGFGKLIIHNLEIKNPKQTAIENILKMQKIELDINFIEFFKKHKTIDRIQIYNPIINIEFYNFDGSESNWSNILNSPLYETKRTYTINNLSLLDVTFGAYNFDGQEFKIWPIPYLEITTFNNPLPLGSLLKIVLTETFSKMISSTNLTSFKQSLNAQSNQ